MARDSYYEQLKVLAREKRAQYGVKTDALGLREIRAIYKAEGIHLDLWKHSLRKVRAAYIVVDGEPHVLLNAAMKPIEPRLFSLCHELKHHLADQEVARRHPLGCQAESSDRSSLPKIEIGAEVFAAEFIFPEGEFGQWATERLRSNHCTAEDVVRLKRVCLAKISYTFIVKRLVRLSLAPPDGFPGVHFIKLEEQIFGVPLYKRLLRRRRIP